MKTTTTLLRLVVPGFGYVCTYLLFLVIFLTGFAVEEVPYDLPDCAVRHRPVCCVLRK